MADFWNVVKRSEVGRYLRHGESQHRAADSSCGSELRMIGPQSDARVKGWRRHQPLPGRPDFVFRKQNVAVFVDGRFWHGCSRCYHAPKTRKAYWPAKIAGNRRRDRRVTRQLRSASWSVLRVRECSLRKRPGATVSRLLRALARER